MWKLIQLSCLVVIAGCSSPSVTVTNTTGAAMKEQHTADMVKSFAKSTPPANASSMGPMTSPPAGNVTIPITNVEVFTFQANVDDDGSPETLFWAAADGVIYVWGQIDIVCVDDNDAETGETGVADFIYEQDDGGYGWMVATDSCGYSTLYGCGAEGSAPEACGGCDFDSEFIVCTAS